MSIPISQLLTGGLPNGDIEIPATNPLNTTQSVNGTTFKYILADILQYILIAQGFTTYTSCRVAATGALVVVYANGVAGVGATLTNAGAQAALTLDGVALDVNDRVLIGSQVASFENGIYIVTDIGSATTDWVLTRADDYNQAVEIVYLGVVAITQGTLYAGLVFQETSQGPFVIGTSPITFLQLQLDISLLPIAAPANKILRSDGVYWVQSTNASLSATDELINLTELQVDNININGNTITSTDVGGDIFITPDTVGSIVLDGLYWPQVDGTFNQAVVTDGAGQLGWSSFGAPYTPSALTEVDDANVTMVLGGTPATALLQSVSMTLGWTGLLSIARGGTDNSVVGANGTLAQSDGVKYTFTTATYPSTATSTNKLLRADGTNWVDSTNTQLTATDELSGLAKLNVDNIEIDGNTISSTNINGDLELTPNGTGDLLLDGLYWPQADGTAGQAVTTNGGGQLGWSTVPTVTVPTFDQSVARFDGTGGAIEDSLVFIDDVGVMSGVTQLNVDNLRLDGNILSSTDLNGNIQINPNGTGQVDIDDPGLEVGGILVDGLPFETALRVNDIGGAAPAQVIVHRHSTVWEPIILSARSNSNTSAHATVTAGMAVFNIYGTGWLNSYYGTMASITFSADTTGTIADGSAPGRLQFNVTPNGALLPVAAMTIVNNGNVSFAANIVAGTWQATTIGSIYGGTGQSTYTLGDTLYSSAANTLSKLAGNITAVKQYLSQTGTGVVSNAPSWATIDGADVTGAALTKTDDTNVTMTLGGAPATSLLRAASMTLGWTGQLGVTRGGTGASAVGANGTLAQSNGLIYTFTTATYPSTTTANQLLYSSATNTVSGLATANSATLVTGATGVPAFTGSMTNGQVLIGSTGATPVLSTLTAAGGITITNAAGSITISGTGGGFSWTEVTALAQTMVANNGYVASNAGQVVLTLPASSVIGDTVKVQGKGAGGWKVAQNAGQTIYFNSSTTTAGVTGYIESTQRYNSVELVCITNTSEWAVNSASGNLTVF